MKKIILFFIVSLFLFSAYAQSSDQKWGFGLGAGIYNNTFKENTGLSPEFYLSRYLNPSFDILLKNEMGVSDQAAKGTLDFNNVLLNLRYKLNNGYLLGEESTLKPYLYGGLGFLLDNMGEGVNFDGGAGVKLALSSSIDLYVEGGYINGIDTRLANMDRSDDFWKVTGGLEFHFGKIKDADGDGVSDRKDECPDTPAGVQVDKKGCPLDGDGDGVPDYKDDCPEEAGGAATNGCPDTDGDGVADKDDDCPDVAGLKKFKGCPDTDGDGVIDKDDKCPDTKKGCPVDVNGCPLDSDGDGVIDCEDDCPTAAGLVENKGCPAEWEEVSVAPIYFAFDKADLRPDAMTVLDGVVEKLNSSAEYDVVISGHTCNIGTENYNQELSEKRAQSVVKYLLKKGVNNIYVGANGYGESKPAVKNTTIANKQKNRRAEFEIKIKKRW